MKAKPVVVAKVLLVVGMLTGMGFCEERISVVILSMSLPTEATQFCQSTIETNYQAFRNLKINGKSEVRGEPVPPEGHGQPVTRQEYEHAKALNIKDFIQLEVRDGVLYGLTNSGETLLLFPQDKKPEKNSPVALTEMYKVPVEAQNPQPKSKEKQTLNLQTVWKIINLNANDKIESALFLHVAQENKAAFWKGYLKNVSDFKLPEALTGLRDALSQCVNDSLAAFAVGSYSALKDAETEALEAKGIEDSPSTQALVDKVQSERKKFQEVLAQASTMIQADKWDDALTALEPEKKYLGQFTDLDSTFKSANDKSYEFHINDANAALQKNALADALREYETALTRKPDSFEAQSGRRESLIRKAIADSKQLRAQKKPGEARTRLLALTTAEARTGDDARIAAELKQASCEFSGQMQSEAQKVVLAPTKRLKPLTEALEKSYIEAFDRLARANEACATKAITDLLSQIRKRLADFHLEHARMAESRGALATALLYGQAAMRYAPNPEASSTVDQMSRRLQDNLRVRVGVILRDATNGRSCQNDVAYFAQALQSQLTTDFILLDRPQTQVLLQTPQSQRPINQILLLGQVQYCSIQRNTADQQVPSKYRVQNPDYQNMRNSEQAAEQQYKSCRSTYGEANCGAAKSNFESIKSQRHNMQEWLLYDYNFTSRTTSLRGNLSLELQVVTSSGLQKFGPFQQQIQDQCLEELDIRDDDITKVGWFGTVSPILQQIMQAKSKSHCPLNGDEQYKSLMQQNVEQNLRIVVPEQIGRIPREYLKRAREGANQQTALENYAMFLLSNVPKGPKETEEAVNVIKSHHNDLQPENLSAGAGTTDPKPTTTDSVPETRSSNVTNMPVSLPKADNQTPGGKPVIRSPQTDDPARPFVSLHQYDVILSYPDNWQVHNGNGFVAVTPQNGFVGNGVARGVMIGRATYPGNSFDKATQSLIEQLQRSNPGMHVTEDPTMVQVNGAQGRSARFNGISPLQENGSAVAERDWLVVLPRSGGDLRFVVFVAPEQEFSGFQGLYEQMLNTLQVK